MKTLHALALAAGLAFGASAYASPTPFVLDFEGVKSLASVGDFYNGGAGGNLGVSFSPTALGLLDSDAGGTGSIVNEPTPSTVVYFSDPSSAWVNDAAGFGTGFSFFYSSNGGGTVNVFDGVNGTGNLLGSISLLDQSALGCDQTNGDYCNWTAVGLSFGGLAKSINFGGAGAFTDFDNMTFGSATPCTGTSCGTALPEPSSVALVGLALAGLGFAQRRRAA